MQVNGSTHSGCREHRRIVAPGQSGKLVALVRTLAGRARLTVDAPQNDNPDAELIAQVNHYLTELEKGARLVCAESDTSLGSRSYTEAERAITESWERVTPIQDWITARRAHGPAGWRANAKAIRASYGHIDAWNETIVMSLVDDLLTERD